MSSLFYCYFSMSTRERHTYCRVSNISYLVWLQTQSLQIWSRIYALSVQRTKYRGNKLVLSVVILQILLMLYGDICTVHSLHIDNSNIGKVDGQSGDNMDREALFLQIAHEP